MLCLEGAQAGLSWLTILRKRESYRAAFDDFDAEKMARYGKPKRGQLLENPGIVRNRLKVDAFIGNNRMRASAYGGPPVALDPAVNRPLARALIAIDTARTRLGGTWIELQSILDAGQTIPYERRVQALYEAALAQLDRAPQVQNVGPDVSSSHEPIRRQLPLDSGVPGIYSREPVIKRPDKSVQTVRQERSAIGVQRIAPYLA
jgi:hypothetical protein